MKHYRIVLAVALIAMFAIAPSDLPSCGASFDMSIFTFTNHPYPLGDYTAGHLGVIQPRYWRRYLFVAYRYLSGKPLTSREQAIFLGKTEPEQEVWSRAVSGWAPDTMKQWLETRGKIPGAGPAPRISAYRKVPGVQWGYYLNCSADAFRAAADTLERRTSAFGASHPGVASWLQAQDTVFSNCQGGDAIPASAQDVPDVFKRDREYQVAAALFYAERFDEAEERFRRIAADRSSEWRQLGHYLALRTIVRKGTLLSPERQFDAGVLAEAERELEVMLGDESLKGIHGPAGKLHDYIALRLHPLERLAAISRQLREPSNEAGFEQRLTDYEFLMDRLDLGARLEADEMTSWIANFQVGGPAGMAEALERWKANGSVEWLVAAASSIKPDHPEAVAVAAAAAAIDPRLPAFPTLAYHRIRLLVESGDRGGARQALDSLLPELRKILSASSLNLFLAQRMRLARSLEEFVRFAPRVAAATTYGDEIVAEAAKGEKLLFDADSARAFNRGMPVSTLRRAAVSPLLPAHLRARLAAVAWVRAILLEDHPTALDLSKELRNQHPALGPLVESYLAARDPAAKRFAAAYLFLKFPGLRPYLERGLPRRTEDLGGINQYRENWWCGFRMKGYLPDLFPTLWEWSRTVPEILWNDAEQQPLTDIPDFLSEPERSAFAHEWKRLLDLPTAPNYLGMGVIAWAKKTPGDPRVPEALHLVVKSTRFGCTDTDSWKSSRSAFRLLHANYPDSPWAKKTKYWYR